MKNMKKLRRCLRRCGFSDSVAERAIGRVIYTAVQREIDDR